MECLPTKGTNQICVQSFEYKKLPVQTQLMQRHVRSDKEQALLIAYPGFGYNGKFLSGYGKSKTSILDVAKDLLYDLKFALDELALEPENEERVK